MGLHMGNRFFVPIPCQVSTCEAMSHPIEVGEGSLTLVALIAKAL